MTNVNQTETCRHVSIHHPEFSGRAHHATCANPKRLAHKITHAYMQEREGDRDVSLSRPKQQ